jgi:glycogen debranching enzyme
MATRTTKNRPRKVTEAYDRALHLLQECATDDGFVASTEKVANYRRVWGRDGSFVGLAALMTGDEKLVSCTRRTLETLVRNQGPHGEIPSNVDTQTGRVSYGGTAGRVDANLWFAICCGYYWQVTGDEEFLDWVLEPLEKVRFLLGSWEFNNRGLLYIPPTGDWADEYVQSGYVLYDQLLYFAAQHAICGLHEALHETADHMLDEKVARLKHVIWDNFWFHDGDEPPDDVYHTVLFKKGRDAAPRREGQYWMPFFSPLGYGYRFDGMANVLTTLLGFDGEDRGAAVDDYIASKTINDGCRLIPAFLPVITPRDEAWDELQMTFSHRFKNEPYEYHNGGLWPFITGLYVASLAARGKTDDAEAFHVALCDACASEMGGDAWAFPEYLHGKTGEPGGTRFMAWSAASLIIGARYLDGDRIFTC